MVRVFLLIDVNVPNVKPSAARSVNALARRIPPQIINTCDSLELTDLPTGLSVQDNQQGRIADAGEQAVVSLIQSERDAAPSVCGRKRHDLFTFGFVHNAELSGSSKRHENPWTSRLFDLDAAWACICLDVPHMLVCAGVDD